MPNWPTASACNTGRLATGWRPDIHNKNYSITNMSKDSIQDVVKKSLEKYFKDLGEQQPSNVYEMVVFTVEKPILEAVMARAEGNQSHAAEMLGINRNTLRKKLQQHGLI
jgi:Fis family transcriptional regulator